MKSGLDILGKIVGAIAMILADTVRTFVASVLVMLFCIPYSAFMSFRYCYRQRHSEESRQRQQEQQANHAQARARINARLNKKKKPRLMSQEDVDEKFPLQSYKAAKLTIDEETDGPDKLEMVKEVDSGMSDELRLAIDKTTTNVESVQEKASAEHINTAIQERKGSAVDPLDTNAADSSVIDQPAASTTTNSISNSTTSSTASSVPSTPEDKAIVFTVSPTSSISGTPNSPAPNSATPRSAEIPVSITASTLAPSGTNITTADKTTCLNTTQTNYTTNSTSETLRAFDRGPDIESQWGSESDSVSESDGIEDSIPMNMEIPDDTCAICIDSMSDEEMVRRLSCGHIFHPDCVDPWLTTRRAYCPLCKFDYYVAKPEDEQEQLNPPQTARRHTHSHPRRSRSHDLSRSSSTSDLILSFFGLEQHRRPAPPPRSRHESSDQSQQRHNYYRQELNRRANQAENRHQSHHHHHNLLRSTSRRQSETANQGPLLEPVTPLPAAVTAR
ncbi:hypothetical protein AWJ20_447 [Sugiyamaella lignohabitans]|uniref:RING-type domain-containing protein n=1 Tax=Sugiyamaella lignohabitans TaxID=796027 RepID=A0A167CWW0_9ASCO|nr:uncharacterized protein AWJ20_447 [Sugiyamaella lignohabitans]ANB12203.1 hypothetical protein AWJ20_447 [Sugiyamaella lignohabitans]